MTKPLIKQRAMASVRTAFSHIGNMADTPTIDQAAAIRDVPVVARLIARLDISQGVIRTSMDSWHTVAGCCTPAIMDVTIAMVPRCMAGCPEATTV